MELHSIEADQPYEQLVEDVADAGAGAVCFSLPAWQGEILYRVFGRAPKSNRDKPGYSSLQLAIVRRLRSGRRFIGGAGGVF